MHLNVLPMCSFNSMDDLILINGVENIAFHRQGIACIYNLLHNT